MRVRADIAYLLREGLTDTQIAERAGVGHRTVAAARKALNIPKMHGGRRPELDPRRAFDQRTRPVDGGHLEWTGSRMGESPYLEFAGRRYTAGQFAFRLRHGRAPVGRVRAGCGYRGCVAPDHVEDEPMRAQLRSTYAAIFGAPR